MENEENKIQPSLERLKLHDAKHCLCLPCSNIYMDIPTFEHVGMYAYNLVVEIHG